MYYQHKLVAVSVFAVLLGACGSSGGGGGGGGGSSSSSGNTTSPVAITTTNADDVAAGVSGGMNNAVGAGNTGGSFVTGVVTQSSTGRASLAAFARRQLERLQDSSLQPTANSVQAAVQTGTLNCDNAGGSVDYTWNDADGNLDFSTGDSFSLSFHNCFDAVSGDTANGGMSLDSIVLTGDPAIPSTAWSLSAALGFSNLQINDGVDTGTINGGFSFSLATTDGITETGSISGSSLTLAETGDTTTLTNFSFNFTENTGTLAYTLTASGTANSTSVGGTATFTTPVPFQGINIDLNRPTGGSMKIVGANNTSVTLTALGGDNVSLAVDSTGDGAVDSTINTTWTALDLL